MEDKYPIEINLEDGLKLQIHREHFKHYRLFLFDSKGEQLSETELFSKNNKWFNY